MVHAGDRFAAIERLRRVLDETEVAGIQTTLPFHRFVSRHEGFRTGELSIEWVADEWDGAAERARYAEAAGEAAAQAVATGTFRTGEPRPMRGSPAGAAPSGPGLDTAMTPPAAGGWAAAARDEAVDRWPR